MNLFSIVFKTLFLFSFLFFAQFLYGQASCDGYTSNVGSGTISVTGSGTIQRVILVQNGADVAELCRPCTSGQNYTAASGTYNLKISHGSSWATCTTIGTVTVGSGGGDTTPPSNPSNLTSSSTTSNSTQLNWTASNDNVGVTGYDIYRNSINIGSSPTNSYFASGLTASTTYSFYVIAKDAAGNSSNTSNTINVETTGSGGGGGGTAQWNGSSNNTGSINRNGEVIVEGDIKAKKVIVKFNVFSDYVFDENYALMPISDLEKFVQKNNHLPNIPSEKEIIQSDIGLSELAILQMEKIEELALYIIELNKRLKHLEEENDCLNEYIKN